MTLRKWLGQSNQRTGTNCCIKTRQWHLYLTHCHIHTETWVQFKLSITLAHSTMHTQGQLYCVCTQTQTLHILPSEHLPTHRSHTHTEGSEQTNTCIPLWVWQRKEGAREEKKQYSREGKWGCHQKTKKTKRRKRTRQEELGRTVISKKHMWERARENDVPDKKTERGIRRKQNCALRDLLREKWKPTLSSDCGSSMTEEADEWEYNREMDWKMWVRDMQHLQREPKKWRVCYAWV